MRRDAASRVGVCEGLQIYAMRIRSCEPVHMDACMCHVIKLNLSRYVYSRTTLSLLRVTI